MKRTGAIPILLLCLLLAACHRGSDSDTPPTTTPTPTEGTLVGTNGGLVSDPDGTTLDIPPGALSQETVIQIQTHQGSGTLPSPAPMVSGAHFTPDGLTFAQPVSVTFPLAQMLTPDTQLPLFIYDAARDVWKMTEFTVRVNSDGMSATGDIWHFSDYVIFGPPYYDANLLALHEAVLDVCSYRPLTEIFDDYVNQVSQTFPVGSKRIWDFSTSNPIRQEACYELSGITFVWNVETSIPDTTNTDPNSDNWISQERRDLQRIVGEEGFFSMRLYDEFDKRIAVIDCGERQVVYQLNVVIWWRCAAPQLSMEPGADKLCKDDSTDLQVAMMCGIEPMAGQTLEFTATGPGVIAPPTDETLATGAASSTLFAGKSAGSVTATASYLACGAQETEQQADTSTLVEIRDAMSVEISLPGASLCVGETLAPSATVLDQTGAAIECYPTFWSSSDPGVVSVNSLTGALTGVAEGSAQVTAISEQAEAAITVEVGPQCMALTPQGLCVEPGWPAKLSVIAGPGVDLAAVVWTSSDDSVATVDGAGNVTAQGEGLVRITADSNGVQAQADLQVRESCLTLDPNLCLHAPLALTGTLPTNVASLVPVLDTPLSGNQVAYSSSNPEVATVDAAGTVRAVAGGTTTISLDVDNVVTHYAGEVAVNVAGSVADYKSTPIVPSIFRYAPDPNIAYSWVREIDPHALFLTDAREIYTQGQMVQRATAAAEACGGFPQAPDTFVITDVNQANEYIGYYPTNFPGTGIYFDPSLCLYRELGLYQQEEPKAINDNGMIAIDIVDSAGQRRVAIASRDGNVTTPYASSARDLNNQGILLLDNYQDDPTWWDNQCFTSHLLVDATMGADPNALLETIINAPQICSYPLPMALNNSNIVVGHYRWGQYESVIGGPQEAYYTYPDGIFLYYDGQYIDIPVGTYAVDVNDSQDILGVTSAGAVLAHVCPLSLKTNVCDWAGDHQFIEGYEAVEATCDGLDNDCDGQVDEGLEAPLSFKQAGVCAGALDVCRGSRGWQPDYQTIAGYEFPEVSCDGQDNDCDGWIDEGDVCSQ